MPNLREGANPKYKRIVMRASAENVIVKEVRSEEGAVRASEYPLEIPSGKVVRFLFFTTAVLVVLNLLAILVKFGGGYEQALGFVPGFSLDKEANIPTFFSGLILLLSGFLFGIIAWYRKRKQEGFVLHWGILSAVFVFMALDEVASFHENLILPIRSSLNLSGIFYYSWVVVGLLFLLAFAASYLKFFFSLSTTYRLGFFLAGFAYICGALGMELVGGYYAEHYGLENLPYALITTVEETLELIGILLLIKYLLLYLQNNTGLTALSLSLKK